MKEIKGLRKGQVIFNFLEYCKNKGINSNQNHRLADTFYVSDERLDELWEEFGKINLEIEL